MTDLSFHPEDITLPVWDFLSAKIVSKTKYITLAHFGNGSVLAYVPEVSPELVHGEAQTAAHVQGESVRAHLVERHNMELTRLETACPTHLIAQSKGEYVPSLKFKE